MNKRLIATVIGGACLPGEAGIEAQWRAEEETGWFVTKERLAHDFPDTKAFTVVLP